LLEDAYSGKSYQNSYLFLPSNRHTGHHMSNEERKLREFYKQLGFVFCPILAENVYFKASGLHHLQYKAGRIPRTKRECIYRLRLLKYAPMVLQESREVITRIKSHNPSVITWAMESRIDLQLIRVVIIRRGQRRLEFLSIMQVAKKPR
jgi:hypothetical protein